MTQASFFSSNLAKRIMSAFLIVPPLIGMIWLGGWFYNIGIAAMIMIAVHEWLKLTAPNLTGRAKIWGYGVPILIMLIGTMKGASYVLGLSILAMPLTWYYVRALHKDDASAWKGRALWAAFGLPYIMAAGLSLIILRNNDAQGLVFIAYLLAVVWGTDTGAYVAGRLIGGPKLLPKISPKKTWAGLVGGMVIAALLGYVVVDGFAPHYDPIWAAGLAALLAVIAQVGDFIESYIKRRAGAKDSSNLIPGHGGLLDRVDGLFPAAIVLCALLVL